MQLSVVIPTRNRPEDLRRAVESLCAQTRKPDEFMVVDQSEDHRSRECVEALLTHEPSIHLSYIHDRSISGLVEAKHVATGRAQGDIVCFLEDDIVLESDYLAQIERGFAQHTDMLGSCGIVTNPPPRLPGYAFLFHTFHRGIFRDIRVGLYGPRKGDGHALIPSSVLSGGLSAWRREVFRHVGFDTANDFHMLEDMEFSTRVARHFGGRLFINPNARLEHHASPVNRIRLGPRQKRKLTEFIVYYKKRRDWPGARLALLWLLLGLFIEAGVQSFSARTFGPLRGYFSGLAAGMDWRLRS